MKSLKLTILPACVISLAGCLNSSMVHEPMTEPAGSAHYLINNQTNQKLKIVSTTSAALGANEDSNTVGQDSSKKYLKME